MIVCLRTSLDEICELRAGADWYGRLEEIVALCEIRGSANLSGLYGNIIPTKTVYGRY